MVNVDMHSRNEYLEVLSFFSTTLAIRPELALTLFKGRC
jgi:hypothetical protein